MAGSNAWTPPADLRFQRRRRDARDLVSLGFQELGHALGALEVTRADGDEDVASREQLLELRDPRCVAVVDERVLEAVQIVVRVTDVAQDRPRLVVEERLVLGAFTVAA